MIILDDMIAAMLGDNKLNPTVTAIFVRGRKPKYLKYSLKYILCTISL